MNNKTEHPKTGRGLLSGLSSIAALLALCGAVFAQPGTYRLPPNVKQYLVDKYQNIREVTSSIQETPHGPLGSLHILGTFLPGNAPPASGGDRNSRATAIAGAFLEEEAALLGISNMDELRTIGLQSEKVHGREITEIRYYRYINNVKLENYIIVITFGPDEAISHINAVLKPTPPELYEATARETLRENKLREIIGRDLRSAGFNARHLKISSAQKFGIHTPPYVIWNAYANAFLEGGPGSWEYRIDAFTGEVIKRLPGGTR